MKTLGKRSYPFSVSTLDKEYNHGKDGDRPKTETRRRVMIAPADRLSSAVIKATQ